MGYAKGLKNVNWRHGPNRPYAVVWVDPHNKTTTRVDETGDTEANWDQTLVLPLPPGPIDDFSIFIAIVHAGPEQDTKPFIGSARLNLGEILRDATMGGDRPRTVTLKRPSGRPQGKLDVRVTIRDMGGYRGCALASYYAPPYGVPLSSSAPPPYGCPYGAPPPVRDSYYPAAPSHSPQQVHDPYYPSVPSQPQARDSYYSTAAAVLPSGVPYNGYHPSAPAMTSGYGQPSYGYNQQTGGCGGGNMEKKRSKFGGMGAGLAMGVAAGALGGLAIGQGIDYIEDKIEDEVQERIEEENENDCSD